MVKHGVVPSSTVKPVDDSAPLDWDDDFASGIEPSLIAAPLEMQEPISEFESKIESVLEAIEHRGQPPVDLRTGRSERYSDQRDDEAPEADRRPSEGRFDGRKPLPRTEPAARQDRRPEPPQRPVASPPTPGRSPKTAGRMLLVNAISGDECRIAVVFENRLEELFIERRSSASHVGNIYKGIITNVEPAIQAAFIDFGLPKHGFLHISDVQPQYFSGRSNEPEGVGKKTPRRDRPPIQKCFRRGQEVIVQITKEGVGTKGPTLTTYLSIPGRYLVMMPGMSRLGVSRKIEDEAERRRMRDILEELKLPKDIGFILRTAGIDRNKRDLQRDLNYLQRLWKLVVERVRSERAPVEVYQESDLITRTIRDVFSAEFDKIVVDTAEAENLAREFLRIVMPRTQQETIELYKGNDPIFHQYGVEEQIEAIHSRHVPLPSGGSLVIDSTEAMVAIDVNSGKFRSADGEEDMAYRTNLEAAREIARQLRLRDLGGLIVCDFIDMRMDRHKREVERTLRDELKKHKERARILRMSQFGLIEMTRQRQGPSIKRGVYTDCPHCRGSGLVKNPESMTLHVLRGIQTLVFKDDIATLTVTVSPDVAFVLTNRKRAALHKLETDTGKTINVRIDATFAWDQHTYVAEDTRGRALRVGETQEERR
ncbi:MAG: Rne/Rng family ribonuclease [Phycisphaerales bacterium]|nr:Rne/Rng family ribonuclease [Phycisphaerales bacterium]